VYFVHPTPLLRDRVPFLGLLLCVQVYQYKSPSFPSFMMNRVLRTRAGLMVEELGEKEGGLWSYLKQSQAATLLSRASCSRLWPESLVLVKGAGCRPQRMSCSVTRPDTGKFELNMLGSNLAPRRASLAVLRSRSTSALLNKPNMINPVVVSLCL
jgi:hypothetical protein